MQVTRGKWAIFVVAIVMAAWGAVSEAEVVRKETFPKIGGLHLNANYFTDAEARAMVARLDLAVLGMWRGWQGGGLTDADVVADIRARAEAAGNHGLILSKYTNIMETYTAATGPDGDVFEKLSEEEGPGGLAVDWWARNAIGEAVSSWDKTWSTNITRFVKPDAGGYRVPEWRARRDYDAFFRNVPGLDSWFLDNWFWRPRVKADWNGDGSDDSRHDPEVQRWYRLGFVDWLNEVTRLAPDVLVMGNVDGLLHSGDGMLTEPEYKGILGGALYEGAMGRTWSLETNSTWESMMQYYRNLLANTKEPHIVIFAAVGAKEDYQMFRYALASALMDNGYLYYSGSTGGGYVAVHWYDEYDLAGTADTDWLGKAISSPPTAPWSKGVYRRDFENGIALVNPKGNGTQTVTLKPGFTRIAGVQDTVVNNGQEANTITLQERDGILLVRKEAVTKPKAPLLTVH